MNVRFLGHSCFLIETSSHRLLIDPFLRGNPTAALAPEDVSCDYILISHGHEDHVADAAAIARANDAPIIANFEIAEYFAAQGLPTHGMSVGGGHDFPFGRASLTLAFHSSSLGPPENPTYLGCPCGIVIEADGSRLYHAGDTALFSDMSLIGRHGLDLAILPIGDNFTMGPSDALDALDFLKPSLAVPMHYNTWELIVQDAAAWADTAATRGHAVKVLAPGDELTLG